MNRKRLLLAVVIVPAILALSAPSPVTSQQAPPCAASLTDGKTEKQISLDECSCQQAAATDKPTYLVGASPFGRSAGPRQGRRARRGTEAAEAANMYKGLVIPDANDLKSPEVAGLKERVLRAREAARLSVDETWNQLHRVLELESENDFASRMLKNPRFIKAHDRFLTLQNSDQWATWPKLDWRERGLDVGPVLNQGECQSCWAFAAMSVYQSSWNLEQMRLGGEFFDAYLPGIDYWYQRVPSIQQLLNCIGKVKGSCDGGWHGWAFDFMVRSQVPHIPDRLVWKKGDKSRVEEYTGRVSRCTSILRMSDVKRGGKIVLPLEGPDCCYRLPRNSDTIGTAFDRALAWGYVNEKQPDEMPSIEQLKQALIEHGPLAVTIIMDKCFEVYQSGVFNGQKTAGPKHALTLIGWDDAKQAWLIKNSWGEKWGEKGFGWVAYGSNKVGRYAAWIQPTPSTERP
jgi:hypothetical protein